MAKPARGKKSDSVDVLGRRTKAELRKLLEAVSESFCKGTPPKEISKALKGEFKIEREAAYRLLQRAAQEHILVFRRPKAQEVEERLAARLKEHGVDTVRVASTTVYSDVAAKTADLVADLLTERVRKQPGRTTKVRVGWAGGELCRMIAQELANHIKRPDQPFPKNIISQTVMGAFDVESPMLHPNTFFSYFSDAETAKSGIKFEFEALYAPVVVSPAVEKLLKKDPDFIRATKNAITSDLVITSVGRPDPRNMLAIFYRRLGKAIFLKELGCVGDFLGIPFSRKGPIPWKRLSGKYRPLTLLDHADVKEMIKRGTNVILAAGPCRSVGGELPKLRTDVIETVIRAGLAKSICVDFQTGKALLARFSDTDLTKNNHFSFDRY